MSSEIVSIRRATRRDIPFLTSSWLRSFRDGAFVRGVPSTLYYRYHHKVISALLSRAVTLVAVNAEDDDQILGWLCAELVEGPSLVVHYAYVKEVFRKQGLAKRLLDVFMKADNPVVVQYTHRTFAVKKIRDKAEEEGREPFMKGWIYNPYLLFASMPQDWYK